MSRAGSNAGAAGNLLTLDMSRELDWLESEHRKARDEADTIIARFTTERRDMTADEEKAHDEARAREAGLEKRIERLRERIAKGARLDHPGESRTRGDFAAGARTHEGRGDDVDEDRKARAKKYRAAFERWARRGITSLDSEQRDLLQTGYSLIPDDAPPELRAQSSSAGAQGGFLVPQEMMQTIDLAQKDFSGVLQSRAGSSILTTSTGADVPWPTNNDTSNEGEQIDENTAQTEGELAFGQITLRAFNFSSKMVLVPEQLIQDAAINIDQLIASRLAERLGRIKNRRFTVGSGASQPQGVVTGSTLGKTAASATAITYDELVDLQHSVDPAYRQNAEFMMNDATIAVLRKLKDSDGRPIWQPSWTSGMGERQPGRLLGDVYLPNQHMATIATAQKTVLYGDMSKYKIRRVQSLVLVRLTERYAEKLQVGFFAWERADGRVLDAGTNPIKHLLQA